MVCFKYCRAWYVVFTFEFVAFVCRTHTSLFAHTKLTNEKMLARTLYQCVRACMSFCCARVSEILVWVSNFATRPPCFYLQGLLLAQALRFVPVRAFHRFSEIHQCHVGPQTHGVFRPNNATLCQEHARASLRAFHNLIQKNLQSLRVCGDLRQGRPEPLTGHLPVPTPNIR